MDIISNIEVPEIPEYLTPNYGSDEAHLSWLADDAEADIRNAEKSLGEIREMINTLRTRCANAMMAVEKMRADHWKDEQLRTMRQRMKELEERNLYGFAITPEEHERISAWMQKHDAEVHRISRYRGAASGGYEYVFYPTGIGTAGDCICNLCKRKSIKTYGEEWYEHCEGMNGVFEFREF